MGVGSLRCCLERTGFDGRVSELLGAWPPAHSFGNPAVMATVGRNPGAATEDR